MKRVAKRLTSSSRDEEAIASRVCVIPFVRLFAFESRYSEVCLKGYRLSIRIFLSEFVIFRIRIRGPLLTFSDRIAFAHFLIS